PAADGLADAGVGAAGPAADALRRRAVRAPAGRPDGCDRAAAGRTRAGRRRRRARTAHRLDAATPMRIAWLFPCVAILLLAACAHRDGRVGREMLLPEGAPRHPVDEERQRFIMAVPVRDPMPVIPDNMHRFRRTVAVCVGFVVTDDGRTVDVVAHEPGVACPQSTSVDATVHAHFRAATVAAVQDWTWFGAAICTFPEGVV